MLVRLSCPPCCPFILNTEPEPRQILESIPPQRLEAYWAGDTLTPPADPLLHNLAALAIPDQKILVRFPFMPPGEALDHVLDIYW